MSISLRTKKQPVTPMIGKPTITLFENTSLFVTPIMNELATMMAMVFEKFIQTLSKECGQMSETIYVLSKVSIKII